jgi:hypothetical protein
LQQRQTKHVLRLKRRREHGRFDCKPKTALRGAVELREGSGIEFARPCFPRPDVGLLRDSSRLGGVVACLGPLRERVYGKPGRQCEADQRTTGDDRETTVPPPGRLALERERTLGLVLRSPGEHGVGQDVVEDLVPGAAAVAGRQRPHDSLVRELTKDGIELIGLRPCVTPEVVDAVGDLRP